MNDVLSLRPCRKSVEATTDGSAYTANRSAVGYKLQSCSTTLSEPAIVENQSWTIATVGMARNKSGGRGVRGAIRRPCSKRSQDTEQCRGRFMSLDEHHR